MAWYTNLISSYKHIQNYEVLDEETEIATVEPGITLDVRMTATNATEFPDFPNPTYKAFMELVEKLKLSNMAENEIINFFNEHSMHSDKPLPATTRLGRAFVDSLDVPHILYWKTRSWDIKSMYTISITDQFSMLLKNFYKRRIFKNIVSLTILQPMI